VRATLENPDHHFWPGQFVNVRLILTTERGAVLIPNQATQISQQGTYVYVVKADNTAEVRPVVLGQPQGEDVVITAGLAANERVVLAGQMLVRPGGPVRIAAASQTTPTASQRRQSSARSGGQ
jgi:multidrug efflux system membrane fusion protein